MITAITKFLVAVPFSFFQREGCPTGRDELAVKYFSKKRIIELVTD